jgi:hypothetical protein
MASSRSARFICPAWTSVNVTRCRNDDWRLLTAFLFDSRSINHLQESKDNGANQCNP